MKRYLSLCLLMVAACSSSMTTAPPPDLAMCASGTTPCGNQCVDLQRDATNCGACGKSCDPHNVCTMGVCTLDCVSGMTICGTSCANLATDNSNCGKCGTVCGAGMICSGGACGVTCQTGLMNCGGTCVNLQSDNQNCGACSVLCSAGQACSQGTCSLTCQTGSTNCNGNCVNLQTDNSNCGKCATACPAGQLCSGSVCAASCNMPLIACSGSCVDPLFDPSNCGACGTVCGAQSHSAKVACVSKVCTIAGCAAGFGDCNGNFGDGCEIAFATDAKNCGSCGNTCPSGMCVSGVCASVSCTDGIKNGSESDIDCGGGCGKCADGKSCGAGADCSSGVCGTNKLCAVASCTDGVKNGNETDIDCGSTCPACAMGKGCSATSDCTQSICDTTSKLCRAALSCKELHAQQAALTDGAYTIDPDGAGGGAPFSTWCDMTVGGGGWTFVAMVAQGDAPNWHQLSPSPNNWENTTAFGTMDITANADYKNSAYWLLNASAVMISYRQHFLLRTDDNCLAGASLRTKFVNLDWVSSGSQSYVGSPASTHPCVVSQAQIVTGEKALGTNLSGTPGIPSFLYFKAGEADGAQDGNKDRDYLSTDLRSNVDYPKGLGSFNSGACSSPNCENDTGGYNADGSGNDIAVPGSASDFYGIYVR